MKGFIPLIPHMISSACWEAPCSHGNWNEMLRSRFVYNVKRIRFKIIARSRSVNYVGKLQTWQHCHLYSTPSLRLWSTLVFHRVFCFTTGDSQFLQVVITHTVQIRRTEGNKLRNTGVVRSGAFTFGVSTLRNFFCEKSTVTSSTFFFVFFFKPPDQSDRTLAEREKQTWRMYLKRTAWVISRRSLVRTTARRFDVRSTVQDFQNWVVIVQQKQIVAL